MVQSTAGLFNNAIGGSLEDMSSILTEKCDVCGRDCDSRYLCRTQFPLGPGRPSVVVRHHSYCDAVSYFNRVFSNNLSLNTKPKETSSNMIISQDCANYPLNLGF